MWTLAHVKIPGNEMVDGIAKDGAKSVLYYFSVALGCNVYLLIKSDPFSHCRADGTKER
jgi:hypothetical protein